MVFYILMLFMLSTATLFAEGLIKGTLVNTTDGYKTIETLKKGDLLYALEPDGSVVTKPIKEITRRKSTHAYRLTVVDRNGTTQVIVANRGHKFLSRSAKNWIRARDIKVGDRLITLYDEVTVQKVERFKSKQRVYKLEVEGAHNFSITYANVIVHNFFLLVIPLVKYLGRHWFLFPLRTLLNAMGFWFARKLLLAPEEEEDEEKWNDSKICSPDTTNVIGQ